MAILDAELEHISGINFPLRLVQSRLRAETISLRCSRLSVLFSSLNIYRYALVLCNVVLR